MNIRKYKEVKKQQLATRYHVINEFEMSKAGHSITPPDWFRRQNEAILFLHVIKVADLDNEMWDSALTAQLFLEALLLFSDLLLIPLKFDPEEFCATISVT